MKSPKIVCDDEYKVIVNVLPDRSLLVSTINFGRDEYGRIKSIVVRDTVQYSLNDLAIFIESGTLKLDNVYILKSGDIEYYGYPIDELFSSKGEHTTGIVGIIPNISENGIQQYSKLGLLYWENDGSKTMARMVRASEWEHLIETHQFINMHSGTLDGPKENFLEIPFYQDKNGKYKSIKDKSGNSFPVFCQSKEIIDSLEGTFEELDSNRLDIFHITRDKGSEAVLEQTIDNGHDAVVVDDGVTIILKSFNNFTTTLGKLDLSYTLKNINGSFSNTNIRELSIPESYDLKEIKNSFNNVSELEKINFAGSKMDVISDSFNGISGIKVIDLSKTTSLSYLAYSFCDMPDLEVVILPESKMYISVSDCFCNCPKLHAITYGDKYKLKTFADEAAEFPPKATYLHISDDKKYSISRFIINAPNMSLSLPSEVVIDFSNLEYISASNLSCKMIQEGKIILPKRDFKLKGTLYENYGDSDYEVFKFPSNLTEIRGRLFYKYTSSLHMDLSDTKVSSLPDGMFADCYLGYVALPRNTEYVGKLFNSRSKINRIAIPGNITKSERAAFSQLGFGLQCIYTVHGASDKLTKALAKRGLVVKYFDSYDDALAEMFELNNRTSDRQISKAKILEAGMDVTEKQLISKENQASIKFSLPINKACDTPARITKDVILDKSKYNRFCSRKELYEKLYAYEMDKNKLQDIEKSLGDSIIELGIAEPNNVFKIVSNYICRFFLPITVGTPGFKVEDLRKIICYKEGEYGLYRTNNIEDISYRKLYNDKHGNSIVYIHVDYTSGIWGGIYSESQILVVIYKDEVVYLGITAGNSKSMLRNQKRSGIQTLFSVDSTQERMMVSEIDNNLLSQISNYKTVELYNNNRCIQIEGISIPTMLSNKIWVSLCQQLGILLFIKDSNGKDYNYNIKSNKAYGVIQDIVNGELWDIEIDLKNDRDEPVKLNHIVILGKHGELTREEYTKTLEFANFEGYENVLLQINFDISEELLVKALSNRNQRIEPIEPCFEWMLANKISRFSGVSIHNFNRKSIETIMKSSWVKSSRIKNSISEFSQVSYRSINLSDGSELLEVKVKSRGTRGTKGTSHLYKYGYIFGEDFDSQLKTIPIYYSLVKIERLLDYIKEMYNDSSDKIGYLDNMAHPDGTLFFIPETLLNLNDYSTSNMIAGIGVAKATGNVYLAVTDPDRKEQYILFRYESINKAIEAHEYLLKYDSVRGSRAAQILNLVNYIRTFDISKTSNTTYDNTIKNSMILSYQYILNGYDSLFPMRGFAGVVARQSCRQDKASKRNFRYLKTLYAQD